MVSADSRRWLWLTTVADVDGPGRALSALLARWPAADPMAVCALRTISPAFRAAIPPTVELFELGMAHLGDLRVLPKLAALCRRWRPAVLHTQLSRADWVGRLIARRLRIPVVSTIHNLHARMYRAEFAPVTAMLADRLDRWTLDWTDRVVAVSNGVQADLARRCGRPDARVIRNGLDLGRLAALGCRDQIRQQWGIPADALVVGTVARLSVQKGLADLVDAAREISVQVPAARFVQIGDGPLARQLAGRVKASGLGGRFHMLGQISNPLACLPALDVFVLPSRWEGLPIALMEAQAAGVPAVGTRVSGIDELIDDGTGVLVPSGDARALAQGILSLLNDPDERRQMGRASAARAAELDAAPSAAAYRALFLELAA